MPLLVYLKHLPGMMMSVKGDVIDTKFFKKGPKVFYSQVDNHLLVLRGEDILGIEHESQEDWRKRIMGRMPQPQPEGGNGGKNEPVLEIPGRGRR
jgi:hypothetical protein